MRRGRRDGGLTRDHRGRDGGLAGLGGHRGVYGEHIRRACPCGTCGPTASSQKNRCRPGPVQWHDGASAHPADAIRATGGTSALGAGVPPRRGAVVAPAVRAHLATGFASDRSATTGGGPRGQALLREPAHPARESVKIVWARLGHASARRWTPTATCGRPRRTGHATPSTRCFKLVRAIQGQSRAVRHKTAGQRLGADGLAHRPGRVPAGTVVDGHYWHCGPDLRKRVWRR